MAKLLKARIIAQRVPKRIKLKIGNGQPSRYPEKLRQNSNCRVVIAEKSLDLSTRHHRGRLVDRIGFVVFDRLLGLLESFLLFAKTRISQCQSVRKAICLRRNHGIGRRLNRLTSAREALLCIQVAAASALTNPSVAQAAL